MRQFHLMIKIMRSQGLPSQSLVEPEYEQNDLRRDEHVTRGL